MFKLIVCALLAVAAAEPGVFLTPPVTSLTTVVSPGSTTISKLASSVVHPSPLVYSTPYGYTHFIKKRSAAHAAYIAPASYSAISPVVATTYHGKTPLLASTSYVSSIPLISQPIAYSAHFIKKRSPQWPVSYIAPSSYITPNTYIASGPLGATTYTTPFVQTVPSASTASLPVAAHLIKKRSAPVLATTYTVPTTYTAALPGVFSHQSSYNLHGAPLVTSYTTPLVYSAPISTHVV
ncbi:cuticular protein hypothetical 13 precursor [Bombyx mori]|uniref:Putative cuticle protein n=1 Tax=Bombyx mori TaxID=7091 RepID=C0H6G9_BOMMO|nr:cuticular protein hypothetical 13 precursor [Bombyx mori]FAA00480.1 TPA: putative cuticle protein [Bombyx mori]